MKIRLAQLEDVPVFVQIGKKFHANTRFRVYPYHPELVSRTLTGLITRKGAGKYVFFVAEDSTGQAVGCLVGCLEGYIFSDKPVANIVHFDVLPEKRMSGAALRLLTAFRTWAENRGVMELCAGVNSGENLDKLDRFFKKLGFEATGGNYAMRIGDKS
jgi:L-amino acid N-acyltransferase YncA